MHTRVSKPAASEWRTQLSLWSSTAAFGGMLAQLRNEFGDRLLTDAPANFYRDATTGFDFATIVGAEQIRLAPGEQPDFEIEMSEVVSAFEVTEADLPGRKRGDEYKQARAERVPGKTSIREIPQHEIPSLDDIGVILRKAAKKKDSERYLPEWGLVIRLNVWCFFLEPHDLTAVMVDSTAIVKDRFSTVWVLLGNALYNAWRNGQVSGRIIDHLAGKNG